MEKCSQLIILIWLPSLLLKTVAHAKTKKKFEKPERCKEENDNFS